ncbi:MAG: ABC transporter ATP-binding protein [Lysobacterales bacterium]|jgi:ABC-2 type transport system ATP-binding protein|nr:MAG: ABC transporter ATP-binding protein [Xanthomonadales bacterium]
MIEVRALSKRYGDILAVDQVSFTVETGEVLGFLGPNGAGKSTTMKMIAGFLAPTSGSARVCGFDVEEQPLEAKRRLGYLPEGAPSYGEMTPLRFLKFIADVRGLSESEGRKRIAAVIEQLHLGAVLHQPIETLSKGFRRRVGLAQAILHDPPVLILDEPTDGLDPNQKHEVRELIRSMAKDKTIIVSTHILEEVHAVCTRAIIIAKGRLLADDAPARLEARSRYHGAVSVSAEDLVAVEAALRTLPEVARVEIDATQRRVTAFPRDGKAIFEPVTRSLRERGIAFAGIELERGRLDEVFRTITTAEGVRT